MFDERFAAVSKGTSWREVEICMKVGLGLHAWLETSSLKYGQKSISSSFLLSLSQFGSELQFGYQHMEPMSSCAMSSSSLWMQVSLSRVHTPLMNNSRAS